MKNCSHCKKLLPLSLFYRNKGYPDGLHYQCKTCHSSGVARWKKANKVQANIYRQRWRDKNRPKINAQEREGRLRRLEKVKEAHARWIEKNPLAPRAHMKVFKALQKGTIAKPLKCEECKRKAYLHAHHEDYTKPLEVRWLCASCHKYHHLEVSA